MKTHLKLIAGVALLAVSSASAQQAVTKPVGFRTETVTAGVFNLMSADLTNAVSAAGTFTGVAGATGTDDAADFTTSLPAGETYICQITAGAAAGLVTEVASVDSATAITLADDIGAAGVAAGDAYEIRAAKTLADLFGAANEAGLTGGGTEGTADVIWIPTGPGAFNRFYYKNGGLIGGTGWRPAGDLATDASATPIVYTDAFFIQAQPGANKEVVLVGHVQTRAATVALETGFNFISRIAPVGQTIGTTNLAASIGTGSEATADTIWNPDGVGGYVRYYIKEGGLIGGNGPRKFGDLATDATNELLASGLIVQRKGAAVNANVGVPDFYAEL